MKNNIPVIRSIWGENQSTKNEIFEKPIFENEIVFVWGIDNQKYLDNLGYKTHLISEHITNSKYSTNLLHFLHKIDVIAEACKMFDEFILLDWDCFLLKPLDDTFYNLLRNGNEIQMPLYCFEDAERLGLLRYRNPNERYPNNFTKETLSIIDSFEKSVRKYSWKLNNWLVLPNFSFFYTRNNTIGKELLELINLHNVEGIADEHVFYLWANCTLDEYINKFEPEVLCGVTTETRIYEMEFNKETDYLATFNNYIESIKNKSLYFKHI